ncbi:unnamed protein product [Symbiodinium sp. CCMP2456]|nr:unnamed protein product [Symbiodinium sp. CCMP2456]
MLLAPALPCHHVATPTPLRPHAGRLRGAKVQLQPACKVGAGVWFLSHAWPRCTRACRGSCSVRVQAISSDVEPESSLLDAAVEAVEEVLQFAPEDTRLMANIIRDYIRAGEYTWASALEKRWLSHDGGAQPVRADVLFREPSLCSQLAGAWARAGRLREAEMWLSCTEIEKVDRWALVAFVRACVQSGELQTADNWTTKLLKIADSGNLHLARAGAVDSDSASRQKEAEDNLVALIAARATLAQGAEIQGVRRWLHRMQRVGIQPSWPVYGRLLQGYAEADRSEDFEELLKEMQAVRVRPKPEAFNHLIKAKVDRHSMDAAADWMQRMAEFRSTPNAATYRMLITSSAVSSSASEAEGWLVAMYQSRLHVPESCVATVVERYSEDRRPAVSIRSAAAAGQAQKVRLRGTGGDACAAAEACACLDQSGLAVALEDTPWEMLGSGME